VTENGPATAVLARRRFLGLGIAGLAMSTGWPAMAARLAAPERVVSFDNLHTGETLRTVYWAGGGYVPEALREIDHVLRDFRTNEVLSIDPALIDLLFALRREMGSAAPFAVISGYRSPTTNARLQRNGGGVATRSLHMVGKAIDIRLPGRRLRDLREAALGLRGGGVGYYPKSNFVHVDTGRVRFW
jgi:uncharacterized protein YcbK (DUF882 family)